MGAINYVGLAPIEDWSKLERLAVQCSGVLIYDAIILADPASAATNALSVEFLGLDVGYYAGEFGVFSSIYHEAIHSPVAELRRHARRLNEALLFPSATDAAGYIQDRDSLRARGDDVENEDCYPIAVYGRRRNSP